MEAQIENGCSLIYATLRATGDPCMGFSHCETRTVTKVRESILEQSTESGIGF